MDEFYNAGFAAKVRSIISKMDDDEAEMFMRFSTYDVLMADIEANRRTVDRRVNEVHKRLQQGVAKSLASLVSKSTSGVDAKEIAALVGVVSKGHTPYEELYHQQQPRGKGGRWSISISREKHKADPQQPQGHPNVTRDKGDVMVGPRFNLTQALDRTGRQAGKFAEAWTKDDPHYASTNKRTYDRIQAGSEALMHSGNPKAAAAGKVGSFFGQYGPEAEKVVGPHMRRTAYRYRGTERRPDTKLMHHAAMMEAQVARHDGIDSLDDLDESQRAFAAHQAAVTYFLGSKQADIPSRLPDKKWSGLQQASGKIPPSEGVIINADGKIITQAVGNADDHYLPFNLKNLKGLQGGHYVRSRSQGGLTTEDIYTGLVSGARSVTVVSRSGVFTVNFADDFRGGRRYNDKAAHMVGRYAKTLDAVKSETVDRRPLSLDERAEIRDEVEREFKDDEYITQADIEDRIKAKETEYKSRPSMTKAELADIDVKARQGNEGDERAYRHQRTELISLAMAKKQQRNYHLDGEGYDAAMRALREQYPYYIDSVHTKYRDPEHATVEDPFTNEKDRGYVKPRYIRPEGANEGYFDKTIAGDTGKGTGKVTADRTNYQNWAHNPERHRVTGARSAAAEGADGTTGALADKLKVKQNIARGKMEARGDESLKKLVELYGSRLEEKDLKNYPTVRQARGSGFEKTVDNAATRTQLMDELNQLHTAAGTESGEGFKKVVAEAEILFKAVRASRAGSFFDIDKAADKPEVPFEFDLEKGKKAAYSLIARDDEIEHEWERQRPNLPDQMRGVQINQLSDEDLAKQASAFGYMGHALKKGQLDDSFAEWAARRGVEERYITSALNAAERGNSEKASKDYLKHSEALHRLRRLQWNANHNPNREGDYKAKEKRQAEPQAPGVGGGAPAGTPQLSNERTSQVDVGAVTTQAENALRAFGQQATSQNTINAAYRLSREFRKRREDALDDAMLKRALKDEMDEVKSQTDYDALKDLIKGFGYDLDED